MLSQRPPDPGDFPQSRAATTTRWPGSGVSVQGLWVSYWWPHRPIVTLNRNVFLHWCEGMTSVTWSSGRPSMIYWLKTSFFLKSWWDAQFLVWHVRSLKSQLSWRNWKGMTLLRLEETLGHRLDRCPQNWGDGQADTENHCFWAGVPVGTSPGVGKPDDNWQIAGGSA